MRIRILRFEDEWWYALVAKDEPMQYEFGQEKYRHDEWDNPVPQTSETALAEHLRQKLYALR